MQKSIIIIQASDFMGEVHVKDTVGQKSELSCRMLILKFLFR